MSNRAADRLLLRSGLRYLYRHKWQALLALIGVTMGVAIVLAVDLANGAARGSFTASAEQLRGAATHRLVNPAGDVPQTLYRELYTTPGAPPMAPVISRRVRLAGYEGRYRLVGLDLFAEAGFRSTLGESVQGQARLGEWLAQPGAAVISAAAADSLQLEIGGQLSARAGGRDHPIEIVAVHTSKSSATRDMLVVDIATAQAVTGMHEALSHIDLILDASQKAWVEERLPAQVTLVDAEAQAEGIAGMSAAFELNLTAMSLLALLVGMFLIFNAMSFAIVQRRDLLGRMRALGITAGQVFRLVMKEAFVVALIGTLLGSLLGIALGKGLTGIVSSTVDMLYYDTTNTDMTLPVLSLIKAVVLGIAGTLVATWLPARQAAATPPLTTLSRSALESDSRRRIPRVAGFGAGLAALGLVTALSLPGGTVAGFAGLFLLLLGAAMLMPQFLLVSGQLLSHLPLRGIGHMAARDLTRHLSRLSTATAALMIALSATIGVAVMVDSMRGSVGTWLDMALSADLYVSTRQLEDGNPLPGQIDDMASALPGVVGVSRYSNHDITVGNRPVGVVGADLAPASRAGFHLIESDGAPWQGFDAGDVLISEPLAHRQRVGPGDRIVLPTRFGRRNFRVSGVFRDYASEHGRLFVKLDTFRQHWPTAGIDTLALFTDGVPAAALRDSAIRQLSGLGDIEFVAAREIYDESMRVFDRTFRITEVLRYLSLLVAVIGILSALMAIQLERRREYAVMRAIGFTRLQLTGLILAQSALLGLLAGLAALPTGLAMAWILTDAIQLRAFGWSMQYTVAPYPLVSSVLLGIAAALVAGLYPAWQTATRPPALQLRDD